jgi:hypothetical protein
MDYVPSARHSQHRKQKKLGNIHRRRQQGGLISLVLDFQNMGSRLKTNFTKYNFFEKRIVVHLVKKLPPFK